MTPFRTEERADVSYTAVFDMKQLSDDNSLSSSGNLSKQLENIVLPNITAGGDIFGEFEVDTVETKTEMNRDIQKGKDEIYNG